MSQHIEHEIFELKRTLKKIEAMINEMDDQIRWIIQEVAEFLPDEDVEGLEEMMEVKMDVSISISEK